MRGLDEQTISVIHEYLAMHIGSHTGELNSDCQTSYATRVHIESNKLSNSYRVH